MPVPTVGVTVFFFFFLPSFLRVIVVCYKVQSRKTTSKYMISYDLQKARLPPLVAPIPRSSLLKSLHVNNVLIEGKFITIILFFTLNAIWKSMLLLHMASIFI
jgi:hypothetical protein